MVAANSQEWIPPGWKVQVKAKNGRKIKCFCNSETGQKFYSKKDVLRYIETGKAQFSSTNLVHSHEQQLSEKIHVPDDVKQDESPEWLPDGWIVELKTRQSGSRAGTKYKCYHDPDSGQKFYSKNEVLRYLESGKGQSWTTTLEKDQSGMVELEKGQSSATKSGKGLSSVAKSQNGQSSAGKLGEGQSSAGISGKGQSSASESRKSQISVSKWRKCRSSTPKLENVQSDTPESEKGQFSTPELEKGQSAIAKSGKGLSNTVKFKKVQSSISKSTRSSQKKLLAEETSLPIVVKKNVEKDESQEWLPDGWTIELKRRLSGSSMGAQYKIYIDPEGMHKFYSRPEVLRYLETAQSSSLKSTQDKAGSSSYKINRVTRRTASSEPTAFQNYITKEGKGYDSSQKTINSKKNSTNKEVAVVASPDWLPPGWTKEMKCRNAAKAKRMDPYYTDPVNGYIFRSKLDVLRYLETGDTNKCAIKPKKRDDKNDQNLSSDGVSTQSAVDKKISGRLTRGQQLTVGGISSGTSSSLLPKATVSRKRQGKASRSSMPEATASRKRKAKGSSPLEQQATVSKKSRAQASSSSEPEAAFSRRKGAASESNQGNAVLVKNGSKPARKLQKTPKKASRKQVKKTRVNRSHSKSEKAHSPPSRFSKRRVAIEQKILDNLSEGSPQVAVNSREVETPQAVLGSREVETPQVAVGSIEVETPQDVVGSGEVETAQAAVDSGEVETPQAAVGSGEVETPQAAVGSGEVETPQVAVGSREVETPQAAVGSGEVETSQAAVGSGEVETLQAAVGSGEVEIPQAAVGSGEVEIPQAAVGSGEVQTPQAAVGSGEVENPHVAVGSGEVETPQAIMGSGEVETPQDAVGFGEVETPQDVVGSREVEIPQPVVGLGKVETPPGFNDGRSRGGLCFCDSDESNEAGETLAAVMETNEVLISGTSAYGTLSSHDAINRMFDQPDPKPELEIPFDVIGQKEASLDVNLPNTMGTFLDGSNISVEKVNSQETEKQDSNKPPETRDLSFGYQSGSSWSDPCLEFAFKTLTGTFSASENSAGQGGSQQQIDPAQTRTDDCSMGLFNFHNDISFGFNSKKESSPTQQLFTDPKFLGPGGSSHPSYSSIEDQQTSSRADPSNTKSV